MFLLFHTTPPADSLNYSTLPATVCLQKQSYLRTILSSYPVYAGDNSSSVGSCETEKKAHYAVHAVNCVDECAAICEVAARMHAPLM